MLPIVRQFQQAQSTTSNCILSTDAVIGLPRRQVLSTHVRIGGPLCRPDRLTLHVFSREERTDAIRTTVQRRKLTAQRSLQSLTIPSFLPPIGPSTYSNQSVHGRHSRRGISTRKFFTCRSEPPSVTNSFATPSAHCSTEVLWTKVPPRIFAASFRIGLYSHPSCVLVRPGYPKAASPRFPAYRATTLTPKGASFTLIVCESLAAADFEAS